MLELPRHSALLRGFPFALAVGSRLLAVPPPPDKEEREETELKPATAAVVVLPLVLPLRRWSPSPSRASRAGLVPSSLLRATVMPRQKGGEARAAAVPLQRTRASLYVRVGDSYRKILAGETMTRFCQNCWERGARASASVKPMSSWGGVRVQSCKCQLFTSQLG